MKEYQELTDAKSPSFRVARPFIFNDGDLIFLDLKARGSLTQKARLVIHENDDSLLHEMIILKLKNCDEGWIRQQNRKSKSYVIMEGEGVLKFKDNVNEDIVLKRGAVIAFDPSSWHKQVINTERLVFLEIIEGPLSLSRGEYLSVT